MSRPRAELPRVLAISPPTVGPWLGELEQLVDAGVDGLMLRLMDRPVDLLTALHGDLPEGLTVLLRPVQAGDAQLATDHHLGLHLPAREPVDAWRAVHPGLLSASCHSLEELVAAELGGADLATLAPVFSPGSKPGDTRPTLGLTGLREACARTPLPVLALGGMGPEQAAQAVRAGAHGVAGISTFFSRGHVDCQGAARLVQAVREAVRDARRDP